jgi:protein-L-isoaspartate(D-aspartate) O-methyltransferase
MIAMEREQERAQLILTLRRNGVTDPHVLDALERTPREMFVPDYFQAHAYEDSALPIASGQTISQPLVVAMMTEALALDRRCKVLEIGTGSGYQAAVLARLCRRVYTIERHKSLLREAESLFRYLDLHNITTRFGDGSQGWPEQAPFDRILVTAAATEVPDALTGQLKPGGHLVVPVGPEGGDQDLLRLTLQEDGTLTRDSLGGVRFVPLLPGVETGRGDEE